jgi:hypothetical protein
MLLGLVVLGRGRGEGTNGVASDWMGKRQTYVCGQNRDNMTYKCGLVELGVEGGRIHDDHR